jgi:hypothetical protein
LVKVERGIYKYFRRNRGATINFAVEVGAEDEAEKFDTILVRVGVPPEGDVRYLQEVFTP